MKHVLPDMVQSKKEARNPLQRGPGRERRHANATGNPQVAQQRQLRQKPGTIYRVTSSAGETLFINVSGRDKWALNRLRGAGTTGCTPITEPAPRWSAYVFNLRMLGLEIETITEPHGGDYPGHHARYVLRSKVTPLAGEGAP